MNMHELLPWFYKLTPSQLFHVALHMWSSLLSLLAIFCKLLSQSSSGFSKRAVSVNLMRVHWFRRRVLCSSTWCCLLTLEAWGYRAKPLKNSDRNDKPVLVHICVGPELGPQPPVEVLPSQGLGGCCSLPLFLSLWEGVAPAETKRHFVWSCSLTLPLELG